MQLQPTMITPGICLLLLLATVNGASAQKVEGSVRTPGTANALVRDSGTIAAPIPPGPRAEPYIVPSHIQRDAASPWTPAWGAVPVVGAVVGAGGGAWVFAGMALLKPAVVATAGATSAGDAALVAADQLLDFLKANNVTASAGAKTDARASVLRVVCVRK